MTAPAETLRCPGLDRPLTIRRDAFGIAHVEAETEHDAYFGQGFVAAQDRLWQMEYDRRRAVGRWAEAAGSRGLAADVMARKLNVGAAARRQLEQMNAPTRAMFEAYSAGVNAYLATKPDLPPEYALTGISPEPWEAWQSIALFKIRHVLMGLWQWKVAVAGLFGRVGAEKWASLQFLPPVGSSVLVPPGATISQLYSTANEEIAACAEHLGFLAEVEAGSNSWAVHGSRTTTGKPVLCNDSHRALDVPNAYWQVHLSCPEFNIGGATFAGFPGYPHFGFNGSVAWNITHTQADYQDLYIEKFDGGGERVMSRGDWVVARHRDETIRVRGADPVTMTCWETPNGPVVHGDPRSGMAISLRYTALVSELPPFDGITAMHRAATVDELFEAQRTWVDPVNSIVAADTARNIGYLMRGEVPIRSSKAGRRMPAPGWDGSHEWQGSIPFEELPRTINPERGFIATANQRVLDADEPYISAYFAGPARADRLVELFGGTEKLTPEFIAGVQNDTLSRPAREWARFLAGQGPFSGEAEQARTMLAAWDGDLHEERAEPVLYAYFRRATMRNLFEPVVGADAWAFLTSEKNPGLGRVASGLMTEVVAHLEDGAQPPSGSTWAAILEPALSEAWAKAVALCGADPATWRWGDVHKTGSRNPLSAEFGDAKLDPPRIAIGGDADTIKNSGYGISGRNDFVIAQTSVYRQVVDFADPDATATVIPGGVSGDSRSAHFADQLETWSKCERVPMARLPEQARAAAVSELRLAP